MIVDDEYLIAQTLSELLRIAGYDTVCAYNGKEALDLLGQEKPDLVLTDILMPKMSGMELLSHIKKTYPDIGVIVTTAYGSIESSVQALKEGAFDYITKPYKEKEIIQALEHYFKHVQIQKENLSLRTINELKDKFLILTSHEMNTPLMVISGYLEILMEESSLDNRCASYVKGAFDACQKLEKIVQGIRYLTYTKADVQLKSLCLNQWLKEAISPFVSILVQRRQKFSMEIPEESVYIQADKICMEEIIRNLLGNAIKFTPDGESISVGIKIEEKNAILFCKDTGDGIGDKDLPHIFDTFYTAIPALHHHTAVNFEYRGAGIGNGLAITKHFAEIQNGKISVESQPGKGSCFSISFPRFFPIDQA